MGLKYTEKPGTEVESATRSREQMQSDLPRAKATVEKYGQSDLGVMIFGDDA